MFVCTECNRQYDYYPDYCECGNDQFEEVDDVEETEEIEENNNKRQLTEEEKAEIKAKERDKIKAYIAMAITLLLCIAVLIMPPHRKPKNLKQIMQAKEHAQHAKLPSVNTYWDDSLPSSFRKDDPLAGLPLLNDKFSSISSNLRDYLVFIGKYFNRNWNTRMVTEPGECKVQFVINKEGRLTTKKIVYSSGNKNLDSSVAMLLTNTVGFSNPPEEYKGERIHILFSRDQDGLSKVSYPAK